MAAVRNPDEFDMLTLPGWQNSGPEHWQSRWERSFPTMRRVVQDDWEAPVFADWSRRLTAEVERCRRPVLLVAHSLGTSLVMRWAQGMPVSTVCGAFLVAPTDVDRDEASPDSPVQGFAPMLLRPLPFASMILASRNDEWVTFERAAAFADAWGSTLVDVGPLGHMGSAASLGMWPQGLVWLGQFIASLP